MTRKFYFLFLILLLAVNGYSQNNTYKSTATIKTDKEQYFIYEPILLDFEFQNNDLIGPRIVLSNWTNNINVIDDKGNSYPPFLNIDFWANSIKPIQNKMFKDQYFLQNTRGIDLPIGLGIRYFPTGKYKLSCVLPEYGNYNQDIVSNTISIEIIDPPANHIKEKLLIEQAYNLTNVENNIDNREIMFKTLDNLIKQYPKSVYRTEALNLETLLCMKIQDYTKGKMIADIVLKDYLNEYWGAIAILPILYYYKETNNIEKGIEYINKIHQKTTNQIVKNQCKNKISEISKMGEK